jgi:hypothetical protein
VESVMFVQYYITLFAGVVDIQYMVTIGVCSMR